jgi:hypothetical protein
MPTKPRRPQPRLDVQREFKQIKQALDRNSHDLRIQFERIAQVQADLDEIKREWERMKAASSARGWQPPPVREKWNMTTAPDAGTTSQALPRE